MPVIVQKFGGSSVADAERIHRCAARAVAARRDGNDVVVVVSAMGKTTDTLELLARQVAGDRPPKREMDQLLATGEVVTIALFAMACYAQGFDAVSFTGPQINLQTDDAFTKARIKAIDTDRIRGQLDAGKIVVVAGFQGVSPNGEVTTLGRGGSNATLVALGAVLKAEVCENYTDVDGVYTADPRIVPDARKISRITYDEMLELSGLGAGVLQTRAVEFAKKYDVPIHVRNSANDNPGTMVVKETPEMEDILVSGAALKRNLVRVTLADVPDRPGAAAHIFRDIAAANIIVDDIIQNVFDDGTANISFTVEDGDLHDIRPVVDSLIKRLSDDTWTVTVRYQEDLAKVSVVGVGMRSHTGVARMMFEALGEAKVNIENITTSEIKISCIVGRGDGRGRCKSSTTLSASPMNRQRPEPDVEASDVDASDAEATAPASSVLTRGSRWTVAFLAALATLLVVSTYAQRLNWRLDLLAHLRPQLGLCLALAAVVQLVLKPRWLAAVWASAAAMAWLTVVPLYLPAGTSNNGPTLSVIHANVSGDMLETDAFFEWVRADPPDLLLLQEVTTGTLTSVAEGLPHYRLLAAKPRRDTRGTAAYVRDDLSASAVVLYPTPDRARPFPQVSIVVGGANVSLLHFSATRPLPGDRYDDQAPAYDAAAVWASGCRLTGVAPIVIGDFNATSHGIRPRDLARRAGLRFAAEGHGHRGTWPAELSSIAMMGVDHALVPTDVHVDTFDVGPWIGGDHRPIRLALRVPANQTPTMPRD